MKKYRFRALLFFLSLLCFITPLTHAANDETLAVITDKNNPLNTLSFDDLKRIYLRKTLLAANGIRWLPLNLPVENEFRRGFSLALFEQLPEDQEQYWNEQYFQGISPPEVLVSEEAVLRFVVITPGSIGYVRKSVVDGRVKILKTINIKTNR